MSIEAISALGSALAAVAPSSAGATALAPPANLDALGALDGFAPGFTPGADGGLFDRIVSQLGEIDAGMQAGGRNSTELALGQVDNLHQTMIAGERTRLQFELAMSVRNRVLEAYQEIMRMQV